MKLNKALSIFLMLCFGSLIINAQTNDNIFPEVGKPCPFFTFTDVKGYSKKTLSVHDFLGQNIVFDFWSKTCMSCIQSFPHTNQLQKQFKDNLKVVLVGFADRENQIKPMYDKLSIKNKLQLIAAFDSTEMRKLIPPGQGVPHLIWVNKQGIIKAITSAHDFNEDNIKKFIDDEDFQFEDMSFKGMQNQRLAYDANKPYLINGNGGNDTAYAYRTVISEWKPGMPNTNIGGDIDLYLRAFRQAKFTVIKLPLRYLYNFAYLGKDYLDEDFYATPLLHVKDTTLFRFTKGGNAEGMYCYSLEIPSKNATREKMMQVMQNDLSNYFGYKAKIEVLEMPCLILTLIDKSKVNDLQRKEKRLIEWEHAQGGLFQNIPIEDICSTIGHDLPGCPRIINETNLIGNINLNLKNTLSNDITSVQKMLRLNGLKLSPAKRKMKVLVIKDLI